MALINTLGYDPLLEPSMPRPDEARSLLRGAGLPKGFEVRLDFAAADEDVARAVTAQLAAVGVRVKPNPLRADLLRDVVEQESSLALYSWSPGLDDTLALRAGMHTQDLARGFGSQNWFGFSDPEVDRGIEKALLSNDATARRDLERAALRRLSEDSAWIPLILPSSTVVMPKNLTYPARPDGAILLAEARLEPEPTPIPLGTKKRVQPDKVASLETR
jgi:peptide/nickel transport system substrate-binding protein